MAALMFVAVIWTGGALYGTDSACAEDAPKRPVTLKDCLSFNPQELTLREDGPQRYRLTTKWRNRDLYGALTNEFVVTGDYTRGIGDGLVRWNDVYIIQASDSAAAAPDSVFFECMEGWSYRSPEDITGAGFFSRLPSDDSQHALRTLVWDAVAFEAFAWTYFDKLKLNETVTAEELEGFSAAMADWGSLLMQGLELTWSGVTELNGESCAVINYRSWANPVESSSIVMSVKGRSLYWGAIWISLEDKQIERATMNEDVIVEIKMGADRSNKYKDMQREVTFEKLTQAP